MVSFTTALVAAAAAAGVLAAPVEGPVDLAKRNTPNSQGTDHGYFYQFWDDGTSGNTIYTNGDGGSYSVTWTNVGDMTSGKGWQSAQPRNISFSGNLQASGNFYLAIYTWSTHGENYILEDYGTFNPCSQGTNQGTIYSDGSNYQYCLVNRGNNYLQNWSVRQNKRTSGTVTTANHYNYYAAHGNHNPLSEATYQILSTEGYGGSGSASMSVGLAGSGSSPPPSSTTSAPAATPTSKTSSAPATTTTASSGSGSCSALYGQCGGMGWNGPTCCASGSTCKVSNPYYSQCL